MNAQLERLIWRRAKDSSEYCRVAQTVDDLPFQIDHIIACHHDGKTVASNLALCCALCNRFKGSNISGIDRQTRRMAKLFNPRRHAWRRHFCYEGPVLVGLTPICRPPGATLCINLDFRIAFRLLLVTEG